MDHVRVGGVCLLAILIAAALPVGVLGQGPEAASNSPSESDNAESGASSIISQSLASKSTQEETISAESVARSNKGLKPLGSTGQTAASQSPAGSDQAASTAPSPSAEEAEAAAPETQTTQAADDAAISDETTEILDEAKEELEEAYKTVRQLKSIINEVNLLNAKLLYTNKLFRNFELSEGQKMKVIENFDRAANTREVKLVFSTLAESFNRPTKKRVVKESYASKPTATTAPKKTNVITEGFAQAERWKKLAGLL